MQHEVSVAGTRCSPSRYARGNTPSDLGPSDIAWNRGIGMIGPSKAGLFLHLLPVYGTLLAALILGEVLRTYHFAGFGLILAGLLLTTRYGAAPGSGEQR